MSPRRRRTFPRYSHAAFHVLRCVPRARPIPEFLWRRCIGAHSSFASAAFAAATVPRVLREHHIFSAPMRSVSSSAWISNRYAVCGTMARKLLKLDTQTLTLEPVPLVQYPANVLQCYVCGVDTISVNPSRTLLATRGESSAVVVIYALPDMLPLLFGGSLTNCVTASVWLSEFTLVTGAHDGALVLWRIPPSLDLASRNAVRVESGSTYTLGRAIIEPKVGALAFDPARQNLGVLTNTGTFYLVDVDADRLNTSTFSCGTGSHTEVWLAYSQDTSLYIVNTYNGLDLIDPRCGRAATVQVRSGGGFGGFTSVSCAGYIITTGTRTGCMLFYDLRASAFLRTGEQLTRLQARYMCAYGPDSRGVMSGARMHVNTHCYDESGTRLLVGGGVHTPFMHGHYLGLWQ